LVSSNNPIDLLTGKDPSYGLSGNSGPDGVRHDDSAGSAPNVS